MPVGSMHKKLNAFYKKYSMLEKRKETKLHIQKKRKI